MERTGDLIYKIKFNKMRTQETFEFMIFLQKRYIQERSDEALNSKQISVLKKEKIEFWH